MQRNGKGEVMEMLRAAGCMGIHMLKLTELYFLRMCSLVCFNYSSINLGKSSKHKNELKKKCLLNLKEKMRDIFGGEG